MKNKRILLATFGVVFLGISFFCISSYRKIPCICKVEKEPVISSYFFDLPITDWSDMAYPCPFFSLKIGVDTIPVLVDLGFTGYLSLDTELISKIEGKKDLGSVKRYGFNGKEYEMQSYELPEVFLGKLTISDAHVLSEFTDIYLNSRINKDPKKEYSVCRGSVGWCFFSTLNGFFDLGNKKIALCNNLKRLKAEGYDTESLIKTPLYQDRGFVEVDIKTEDGVMRCVLDTGCNLNVLNTPPLIGQTEFDLSDTHTFSDFYISDVNFGETEFVHLPIDLPIHVDAILGMKFFLDHMVFLDFQCGVAYFAPSVKEGAI